MSTPPSTAPHDRTAPLTDALIDTLREETRTLDELDTLLERQLEAVRAGAPDALEETAMEAHTCAAALDQLRQTRTRQTGLLGRVLEVEPGEAPLRTLADTLRARPAGQAGARLAEARAALRSHAQSTQRRGETLSFALEYAADLNRNLLLAMQGAGPSNSGSATYTATGTAAPSTDDRSFVNTVG